MSEFLRALGQFRNGAFTKQQLLGEVDRLLGVPGVEPVSMLASLDANVERTLIPPDLHDQIAERLLRALKVLPDPSAEPERPVFRDPDSSATVLVEVEPSMAAATLLEGERVPEPGAHPVSGRILKHRFRLLECVGAGGIGRVFKALDLRRVEANAKDVYVAVKLLALTFRECGVPLPLLQREAAKLQELPHPNIVRVIDCDRDGQTVFMTMEYLEGQPLKKRLAALGGEPMPREQVMHVLEGIAAALTFAHRNHIVHGDLKPGNVFLTVDNEVKVIDFGIARVVTRTAPRALREANNRALSSDASEPPSALSPAYASPEMIEQAAADPRDDVYALACMTYEMLTGVHPFDRVAATTARDSGRHPIRRTPLTRAQFNAIAGGLNFDRATRTPTIEQFMRELRGDRVRNKKRIVLIAALGVLAIAAEIAFVLHRGPANTRLAVGEDFRDCPACPLMKVLPAGRFEQGAADSASDAQPFERPLHAVTLRAPLAYGVQEVTKAQFQAFIAETGRDMMGCATYDGEWAVRADANWTAVGFPQTASHPVTCVSWADATAYARWLSAKSGHRYRLPTASEWEFAARGGQGGAGNPAAASAASHMCAVANTADESAAQRFPGWKVQACSDGYTFTAPVGAFAANEFGLNDLFGNVFEWVEDCWHENYENAPVDGSAWVEKGCKEHEMRGGSWFTEPTLMRASYRNRFAADYRSSTFGFRVVREVDP